jgi:hypothetical protein
LSLGTYDYEELCLYIFVGTKFKSDPLNHLKKQFYRVKKQTNGHVHSDDQQNFSEEHKKEYIETPLTLRIALRRVWVIKGTPVCRRDARVFTPLKTVYFISCLHALPTLLL